MAIYRGAGGAGDATNDATSQAILAAQSAQEAAASEAAAASSASSAATSATNAASSATAAANSATSAANSASSATTQAANAASSATTATTKAAEAADSATAAASSASAAATSATNAASSATAAANSATSASSSASAASTSASNAATYASNAATSATNASASETNAASSANSASNSATSATASATSAGNSASSATTSATNAASSASAAATSASNAATSATSASNSATSAGTSETNAANSASSASTSATNAASSASGAASSASSAAASAAAAAASLDSFDDRYLGSKTADPTLDNDGNALVTGALYYNSIEGEMRVYDGFQWIAASAASQAILIVYKYTATAGQTTFTGTDDNALTLAYTVGSIIVTVNGVVQEVGTDVTASTGTSIVLSVAASAGDEVNIHAFSTFDVANTYTKAEADAKYLTKVNPTASGNLTFTGTGNRILGDFSNATVANRVAFQTSTANSTTSIPIIPNGTGIATNIQLFNSSDPTNAGRIYIQATTSETQIVSDKTGTGTYLPIQFWTNGSERMRIDTSGNVGIGTSSPVMKLDVSGGGIKIGYQAAPTWTTDSFLWSESGVGLNIDGFQLKFNAGNTRAERMRIDSSGNLLVGTTSALGKCTVNGYSGAANLYLNGVSSGDDVVLRFGSAGTNKVIMYWSAASDRTYIATGASGGVYLSNGGTSWTSASDERVKDIIEPITNATEKLANWRTVIGKYKTDKEGTRRSFLIAQDVLATFPEAVDADDEAELGVRYQDTIPVLVKAIQEQQAQIEILTAKVAALEAK